MRLPGIDMAAGAASGALELARRAERDARWAAGGAARWATLTVLDGILASSVADEAVDRVLASQWAERTLVAAVEADQAQRALATALESPALERALAAALASPALERAVSQVIDSRVADEAVSRIVERTITKLPESAALWLLVDAVAQSPAVREAISSQGVSFAGELADDVRERSRRADAQLEGAARRVLRWRRPNEPLSEPGA